MRSFSSTRLMSLLHRSISSFSTFFMYSVALVCTDNNYNQPRAPTNTATSAHLPNVH